jgi:hypothetical protein
MSGRLARERGRTTSIGFFSRRGRVNPDSGFSVLG